MTIAVWVIVVILFAHWMSDFVFQPHWMSVRKSKEWQVLFLHGLTILTGLLSAGVVLQLFAKHEARSADLFAWAAVNAVAHVGIDAVTSRATGRLWKQERIHDFFVVIGFDQFLHVAFAIATFAWLVH